MVLQRTVFLPLPLRAVGPAIYPRSSRERFHGGTTAGLLASIFRPNTESARTMKAVIIKGLKDVAVEDRPIPSVQSPTDIVVKTHVSGLCGERSSRTARNHLTSGSDLHNYRQAEPGTGFSLGHEVVGEVVETGPAVTKFKVGDVVSAPFSICCGESRAPTPRQVSAVEWSRR